jgi:hypothetical protein
VVAAVEPAHGDDPGDGLTILISTAYRKKGLMHRKWKALFDNETADQIRRVGPRARRWLCCGFAGATLSSGRRNIRDSSTVRAMSMHYRNPLLVCVCKSAGYRDDYQSTGQN